VGKGVSRDLSEDAVRGITGAGYVQTPQGAEGVDVCRLNVSYLIETMTASTTRTAPANSKAGDHSRSRTRPAQCKDTAIGSELLPSVPTAGTWQAAAMIAR